MRLPTRNARTVTPVAASVSAVADVSAAPPAVPNDGYRETAHVRDYYRTAKL